MTSRHTSVFFKMAGEFLVRYVEKDVNFLNVWIHLLPFSIRRTFSKLEGNIRDKVRSDKGFKSIIRVKERYCKVSKNWHSLYDRWRFRATCEGMWQYPDPRIGGLVYDTLSFMYAEF